MTTVEHQPTKSVVHDNPSKPPQESLHWKRVVGDDITANQPKDLINSHEELIKAFQTDVSDVSSIKSSSNNKLDYTKLALWSIIIGYCEALATHKDETRRFSIFPIPLLKQATISRKCVGEMRKQTINCGNCRGRCGWNTNSTTNRI